MNTANSAKKTNLQRMAWPLFLAALFVTAHTVQANEYTLMPDKHGMILKTPGGRTMFRYMTKKPEQTALTANSVCCLFPVHTPAGERVVDFAPSDHPHHRGVFLAWHAIDARPPADFWGWGEWAPTEGRVIENRSVRLTRADATGADIAVRNDWTVKGRTLIEESTRITAREAGDVYVIDLDFQLTPRADLTLRHTAFGGFCAKARKDGKGVYRNPDGEVNLPAPHHLKPETNWPPADWYAYTMSLESGKTVGLVIMDHPGNPPTLWHNLQAIAMVNPCIAAKQPVMLKAKEPLRLRYRLVTYDGSLPEDTIKELNGQWREAN